MVMIRKSKKRINFLSEINNQADNVKTSLADSDTDSEHCVLPVAEVITDSEHGWSAFSGAKSESDEAEGVFFMFLTEPSVRLSVSGSVRPLTELSVVPYYQS